ncbi:MAG: transglycosylase domain-containing protein [Porphyromonas sp.]|nr:transglycosylase domain-containing protein [Porphyromonas sp.]
MQKWVKTLLIVLWSLFVLGVLGAALLFHAIASGWIGYMPPITDLQNPIDKYASRLISEDNVVLGSYALKDNNRVYVSYEELSPELVQALVATEDKRYANHSGIDVNGVMRAFVKTVILRQKGSGGGSTITQQLAKQLYSPQAANIWERALQKPIEWVIAVELERYYTKEEIITFYLNKFDFLYQAVGIESAAQTYFNTTPAELRVEEAATLVGMCKNPSLYNPKRFPERSQKRRNTVLMLMEQQGYISRAERDSLWQLPVELDFRRQSHQAGLAPYLRAHVSKMMMAKEPIRKNYRGWQKDQYVRDSTEWVDNPLYGWCNKNLKANGKPYNIYTDGLKIYTGVNSKMQEHAEAAMLEHLAGWAQPTFDKEKAGRSYAPFSRLISEEERKALVQRSIEQSDRYRQLRQGGMSEREVLATFDEPTEMEVFVYSKEGDRYITAMKDTIMTPRDSILYHKKFLRSGFMAMDNLTGVVRAYVGGVDYGTFQYDMASQGRRQVGSVMKPFLYAMAMNEGFTPCDEMLNVQPHIRDENGRIWSPRNPGNKRVGEMVTVNWGLQNSSNWVTAWLMSQMSPYTFVDLLHSFGVTGTLDPVVSISLGTPDISVEEMVTGFSTFANAGIRAEPIYVTRIEDQYGNVVAEFVPHLYEVLSEEGTYKTLHMLRNVMNGGTGSRVRFRYNIQADMGGKTGTSQNQSDSWFMCFTPRISTGCWVGGEDRSIHFDTMANGQGAAAALPISALFFKKVFGDEELKERAEVLGINPALKFEVPEQYADPCKSEGRKVFADIQQEEGIDPLFE